MSDRYAERMRIERWLELQVFAATDPATTATRLRLLGEIRGHAHAPEICGTADEELADVVAYVHRSALEEGGQHTISGRELMALGDSLQRRVHRGGG